MGVGQVHYFCDDCWEAIELLKKPWCQICGAPFSPSHDESGRPLICQGCRSSRPAYGKLRAVAFYDATMREAIHLLKYEKKQTLAKPLIRLCQKNLPDDLAPADYDFLIPIPLHAKRHRKRGFNQSERIAQGVADVWQVPVRTDVLFRIRNTVPQSRLNSIEARAKNIAGAFEVRLPEEIRGRSILLIDDIFTTGVTVNEAIGVLQTAQPAVIDVLTLTRTRTSL
jgi:ComF family protein